MHHIGIILKKIQGGFLDKTDIRILNTMAEDCSRGYKNIANKLGITIGTVHNRIKKLEKEKIIQKYCTMLDCEKLGYGLTVLINVTITGGHLEEIEKKYSRHKNVCAVYDVTGGFDMVMVAKFKETPELNAFVKKLMAEKHVERTNTSLVLNIIKEETAPFPLE